MNNLRTLISLYKTLDSRHLDYPYALIDFSNLKNDLGIDIEAFKIGIDYKVRLIANLTDNGITAYTKDPFFFTGKGIKKIYANKEARAKLTAILNKKERIS